MKSLFSQSGQIFLQFRVFEAMFEAQGNFFGYLKTLFVTIIVLKTTVSIPRFQRKDQFEKRTTLCQDICKKNLNMARKTKSQPHFVFLKYLGPGWPIFKTDFALKPWH